MCLYILKLEKFLCVRWISSVIFESLRFLRYWSPLQALSVTQTLKIPNVALLPRCTGTPTFLSSRWGRPPIHRAIIYQYRWVNMIFDLLPGLTTSIPEQLTIIDPLSLPNLHKNIVPIGTLSPQIHWSIPANKFSKSLVLAISLRLVCRSLTFRFRNLNTRCNRLTIPITRKGHYQSNTPLFH